MDYLQIEPRKSFSDEIRSSVLMSHTDFAESNSSNQEDQLQPINDKYSGIQNGLQTFKINRKYLKTQISLTTLIITNLLLQITYFEMEVDGNTEEAEYLLWALVVNCMGELIACWHRYNIREELSKQRKEEKSELYEIVIEFCILLIQPYPFFENVTTERRSYTGEELQPLMFNHFIILFSVLKFVYLARGIFQLLTKYSNPRSFRVCKFYGIQTNYFFHLRCLFRDHPAGLISTLYVACLFIFSYGFRISEINVNSGAKMEYFDNAVWLALLGMTSVGYGDMAPITQIGSIISLIGSFFGVIATSLFVLSITLNLQMNYREERSLIILKRIEIKSQIKEKSARFIRLCVWRKWKERKYQLDIPMCPDERSLMRQLNQLRESLKKIAHESVRFEEAMIQHFQFINAHLLQLSQNEQEIMDLVADKQAVMKGVARRMFSKNMGKSIFIDKINEMHEKIDSLGIEDNGQRDGKTRITNHEEIDRNFHLRKTCVM